MPVKNVLQQVLSTSEDCIERYSPRKRRVQQPVLTNNLQSKGNVASMLVMVSSNIKLQLISLTEITTN